MIFIVQIRSTDRLTLSFNVLFTRFLDIQVLYLPDGFETTSYYLKPHAKDFKIGHFTEKNQTL
jgi:hypothetical protein